MQKIYEWDKSLETGNEIIDAQHKSMFSALNNLITANEEGKAPLEIQKTIEFLAQYIIQHFADEEKLQEECGYPHIIEHKNRHLDLRNNVTELLKKLYNEGCSSKFVEHIILVMTDWLTRHIKGDDFKLAAYIKIKDLTK
ncbi:MAG: hemerythrin family protein [Endomicrobia bacterium]|nr:hemerythrin family protein [Endomicrobiia bacterium]